MSHEGFPQTKTNKLEGQELVLKPGRPRFITEEIDLGQARAEVGGKERLLSTRLVLHPGDSVSLQGLDHAESLAVEVIRQSGESQKFYLLPHQWEGKIKVEQ